MSSQISVEKTNSPQKPEIQPSCSIRCRAEKSEPSSTLKLTPGDRLDFARDAHAVHFASNKRFKDQQVQGHCEMGVDSEFQGDSYRQSMGIVETDI